MKAVSRFKIRARVRELVATGEFPVLSFPFVAQEGVAQRLFSELFPGTRSASRHKASYNPLAAT